MTTIDPARQIAASIISSHRPDEEHWDRDCACGWSDPGGDRYVLQEEHVLDEMFKVGISLSLRAGFTS